MSSVLPVVIDVSAVPPQPGGVGTYARGLIRCLPDAGIDPIAVSRVGDARKWDGARQVLRLAPAPRPLRLVWEQLRMLPAIRRTLTDTGLDPGLRTRLPNAGLPTVLHSPHYTMPLHLGARWRPARVVTIHDLTFYTRPQDHTRSKRTLFRFAIERAVRDSDAIIAVSAATANQLERLLPVRSTLHVIPHGIDHERFTPDADASQQASDRATLDRLGVPDQYLLHLGTIEPRKNLGGLLAAYAELLRRWTRKDEPPALVLAGGAWAGAWESLRSAIAEIRDGWPEAQVLRTGPVDDDALAPLYRQAVAVLYPSFEEGFGLPILEALACGACVITSADTVMHEITGDVAIAVDPTDPTSIARGIEIAIDEANGLRRDGLLDRSAAGVAVAANYRWSQCAQAHADVYRALG